MFRGPWTVIVREWVAVVAGLAESVKVTAKVLVPAAVGMPEITPVDAFKESQVGRFTDDHVYVPEPPVAVRVCL